MLFAMLWQSLAMARIGSTVNPWADLEHAALHWKAEAHHHHADGAHHVDASKESAKHMVAENLSASLAMQVLLPHDLLPPGSIAPTGRHEISVPHPILDGLLRPPRSRA